MMAIIKERVEFKTLDGAPLVMTWASPPEDIRKKGAVLLIHGFSQNQLSFDLRKRSMSKFLANNGYDTYNIDLRGHGLSRKAGSSYPECYEDYVKKDVPAAIKKIKKLSNRRKVFIVGHSLGGAICYSVSSIMPESIKGVITIGGVYCFGLGQPLIRYGSKILSLYYNYFGLKKNLLPYIPLDLFGLVLSQYLPIFNSRLYIFPFNAWEPGSMEITTLIERVVRGFDRTGVEVFKLMVKWVDRGRFVSTDGRVDYGDAFRKLNIPLLVITGCRDLLCAHEDAYPAFDESSSHDKTYKMFSTRDGGVRWGHIDLICGKKAPEIVWPFILDWLVGRS